MSEVTKRNWEDLANAIILRAVDDYRSAVKKKSGDADYEKAKALIQDVDQFVYSPWFSVLTNLDGDRLLARLQRETIKLEEDI